MPLDKTSEFLISGQLEMERLFAKNQLLPRIRREFEEANIAELLAEKEIPNSFGMDLLVQMSLHKQAGVSTMVGILKNHFQDQEAPEQAAADMLVKAAEADIIDIRTINVTDITNGNQSKDYVLVVKYDITQDVQEELDQFQFPLPMIEPPVTVTRNNQTGYQTIKGSIILKNNHHEDDVCLDHINRMNATALSLNSDVVAFVQNRWKDLDTQREEETREDFVKRKKAFAKYDISSRDVITALMTQGNKFWLTHRYDKRGRTYCQGYHVTYQGNDWNKACIEFADAEVLQ